MDRQKFLSLDQEVAGRYLLERLSRFHPIEVAFWFRYADDDNWHLNITFASITRDEFDEAFAKVREISECYQMIELDPFSMDFLKLDYPMVQRARELSDDVMMTRSNSQNLIYQGSPVESIVVYPRLDVSPKEFVSIPN